MQSKNLSLHHIVRPSDPAQTAPPVLFMFHGYGSNEEDLFSFAPELPGELFIISVRAPYGMQGLGYAWYSINFDAEYGKWSNDEQAIESRDKISNFIDEACAAYGLDDKNVTLLGFSQGTILSYAVALSFPDKVKNLIALSGYINEKILIPGYADKSHKNLRIYASHGMVDQVIPPEWAQKAPEFLKKLGIDYVYEEFPVGHGVSPQNFHAFKKWLLGKV
ncbi:alpha/beta fold hydrolase [Flavobacteriaceae bacterium F89]|uniref:Alpha/beta fold hydrolase n=1 Tax=Cerina litoralis TaxID=2874477 RepID=A0AAE3EUX0_9FLAO|nr:alpha/beta fold hydrolase [Cerina litoralis]MCG2461408.1 alpha/beta fold hydrolase [Cerina litoralis]